MMYTQNHDYLAIITQYNTAIFGLNQVLIKTKRWYMKCTLELANYIDTR
mgnify:CR=1 FL=1